MKLREQTLNEMDNAVMDVLEEGADCISNIAIELRVLKLHHMGLITVGVASKAANGKITTMYEMARTRKAA